MADAKARISFRDVRASMKRMQSEGERLVTRIRKDAQALAARSRRETVSSLLGDARKFQNELRDRAERAIKDLEARRGRILASLEEQATRLVERVVKRLNVASQEELLDLRKRVAEVERRIDTLAKEKAERAA
jgi:hypothetical protein